MLVDCLSPKNFFSCNNVVFLDFPGFKAEVIYWGQETRHLPVCGLGIWGYRAPGNLVFEVNRRGVNLTSV